MYCLISLAVFLISLKASVAIECNPPMKGCVCSKTKVSCYQLVDFPWTFPADTTHIFLDEMTVLAIPAGAFSNLPHLTKIEMTRVNVGFIQGCAFKELPSLKHLDVKFGVFGAIHKMAFWNTSKDLIVKFYKSRITKIHSFAFMQMINLKSWVMHDVKVEEIHQNAFYKISHINSSFIWEDSGISNIGFDAFKHIKEIGRVKIRRNNFTVMSCDSLSDLMTSSTQVDLSGNKFHCNCSINWLLQSNSKSYYKQLIDLSTCNEPKQVASKQLNDLKLTCTPGNQKPKVSCDQPDISIPEFRCPKRERPEGMPDETVPSKPRNGASKIVSNGQITILIFAIVVGKLFY